MQIDFHHGVTYVVARLAGFAHRRANTIAYCAQYVDDATNDGTVHFQNGAMYQRISSAHKMLDYRNFKSLANHRVWIPFHFLPGNGGLEAGKDPRGSFINKIICRPNSPVALDMVRDCIRDRDKPYGLHRLGITLHVYADTWAHQGFAGVNHKVNEARAITRNGKVDRNLIDRITNFFIGEALPLGHGTVLGHPDKPFLIWGYTNSRGQKIRRDNPRDFLEAAEHMCIALQRYLAGDPDVAVPGLPPADRKLIDTMLRNTVDEDGDKRHEAWLGAIADGKFSFGPAKLTYVPKGQGSWKHRALGTKEWTDDSDDRFPFKPQFLSSDWKQFHDALQAHRFDVTHDILPRYGICAS